MEPPGFSDSSLTKTFTPCWTPKNPAAVRSEIRTTGVRPMHSKIDACRSASLESAADANDEAKVDDMKEGDFTISR
jgi:hypothetical protein